LEEARRRNDAARQEKDNREAAGWDAEDSLRQAKDESFMS